MFVNETFAITTTTTTNTTKRTISTYVKAHPFDSWYIGGLLFMLTVILVLLYANYYRENAFQILWYRFLSKLGLIQLTSTRTLTSSNAAMETIVIWLATKQSIKKTRSDLPFSHRHIYQRHHWWCMRTFLHQQTDKYLLEFLFLMGFEKTERERAVLVKTSGRKTTSVFLVLYFFS